MTKYEVKYTSQFKKDYKLAKKRGYDISLLKDIIKKLANDIELEEKNYNHELTGNWKNHYECHIRPDWLLIYRKDSNTLVLTITRTGSHSDLFSK